MELGEGFTPKVTFEVGLMRMKWAFPCGEGRGDISRQRK